MTLVGRAIECDQSFRETYLSEAQSLTGLENPNSTQQLKSWFAENGLSQKIEPKELIEDGQVDALVAKDLSRIGRHNAKVLLFLDYLDDKKVRLDSELCSLWEQRLTEYEGSDKSIKTWCKEQAVRENQFYYWRKKLRTGQTKTAPSVKWLSLDLQHSKQASTDGNSISLHIGEATIEIRKGFDHHLLREIVQILQTI
ncbi:MAG: hypothetical protein A4E53_02553 [Pelotomaculum sp. PtaB.Bin104]|nr:MAG: hypothetical protein A4E53_02553 [Pelotomaculum sp. PtaB.Bin104]